MINFRLFYPNRYDEGTLKCRYIPLIEDTVYRKNKICSIHTDKIVNIYECDDECRMFYADNDIFSKYAKFGTVQDFYKNDKIFAEVVKDIIECYIYKLKYNSKWNNTIDWLCFPVTEQYWSEHSGTKNGIHHDVDEYLFEKSSFANCISIRKTFSNGDVWFLLHLEEAYSVANHILKEDDTSI